MIASVACSDSTGRFRYRVRQRSAFKGRVIQYVGRLLRPDPGKTDIVVHDHRDPSVVVLVAMARKRLAAYRQLGFETPTHLVATPPSRLDDAF